MRCAPHRFQLCYNALLGSQIPFLPARLEFFDHACHIGEICVKGNTSISNFRDKIFDMTQQGGEADSETSSVKKKPRSAKKMMKKSDIDFGSDIGSDGMVTPQAQTPKRRKKATKKSAGGKRDIVGSSDEDEDGFHSANLPSKKSKPAPAKGSTLNFS